MQEAVDRKELENILNELSGVGCLNHPFSRALSYLVTLALLMYSGNRVTYPALGTAGLYILVAGAVLVIIVGIGENRRIGEVRDGLEHRIRQVSLVEVLLHNWRALPDITQYAGFPWKLFLGKPARSQSHMARIVGQNLDWYLTEPRPVFRYHWVGLLVIYLVPAASFAVVVLTSSNEWFLLTTDRIQAEYGSSFRLLVVGIYTVFWLLKQYDVRRMVGATVLHDYIREYTGIGE